MRFSTGATCATLALVVPLGGCDGESLEAEPIDVPIVAEPLEAVVVNDLGYTVTVTAARQLLVDLEFTVGGEAHAVRSSAPFDLLGLFVGRAHAHPGHAAGGAVRGELPGRHLVDWIAGGEIGFARVLPGAIDGVDFGLGTVDAGDGLTADDPLLGANLYLEAAVERGEDRWSLAVAVPQDADRRVYGAPCVARAEAGGDALPVALRLVDPYEGDTAFDGLDFAALDADGDGRVDAAPNGPLVNRLRRTLQTHDHYGTTDQETP